MADYAFDFNGTTVFFSKDETDRDKYIVFACAKNEDQYIEEWVEHYLNLGFDKIILADNNDSPGTLKNILSKYVENGKVQIFDCCGLKKFQLYIYNMFLKEGNYKWCAYFDCDEFLELNVHASIKEFLEGVKENCVLINWLVFGSNGAVKKENGTIQKRFKIPVSPISFFKENFYVKPIIRGGVYNGAYLRDTHCPVGIDLFNIGGYYSVDYSSHVYYPPRYKYAYIKHYYTKSFEEWISNKTQRGWPDEMYDILRPANYFIISKNPEFQKEKYINGFFVDNNEFTEKKIHETYDDVMAQYELIELYSSSKNLYSLTLRLYSLMSFYSNHIFAVSGDIIDDPLFANMLEYAFITGNRICFIFNEQDINRAVWNKTKNGNGLYYYIDCK